MQPTTMLSQWSPPTATLTPLLPLLLLFVQCNGFSRTTDNVHFPDMQPASSLPEFKTAAVQNEPSSRFAAHEIIAGNQTAAASGPTDKQPVTIQTDAYYFAPKPSAAQVPSILNNTNSGSGLMPHHSTRTILYRVYPDTIVYEPTTTSTTTTSTTTVVQQHNRYPATTTQQRPAASVSGAPAALPPPLPFNPYPRFPTASQSANNYANHYAPAAAAIVPPQTPNGVRSNSPINTEPLVEFAWDVFRTSRQTNQHSNLVLSPLLLQITLALLQKATVGESYAQIGRVIRHVNSAQLRDLSRNVITVAAANGAQNQLGLAAAIFADQSFG